MKLRLLAALACFPLLPLLTAPARAQDAYDPAHQFFIGEAAPAFELPRTDGETLSLESLRGQVVVIHFGTSW